MAKVRRSNTKILEGKLREAAYKREQEQSSAPYPVDLPPHMRQFPEQVHISAEGANKYPQLEPARVDYPRVVLTESRSIWSDGSVTTEVRTFSKGN